MKREKEPPPLITIEQELNDNDKMKKPEKTITPLFPFRHKIFIDSMMIDQFICLVFLTNICGGSFQLKCGKYKDLLHAVDYHF